MHLIQISAWNDSGGSFLHRLLDGHPALRSWPFELLLGRDHHAVDRLDETWFRGRFRWPRLSGALTSASSNDLFDILSDAELKGVLRDPQASKHRLYPLALRLEDWREETARRWAAVGTRTQGAFLKAYVDSFFFVLEGRDDPRPTLAHCPVAIIDAPETWADFPDTRFVCVLRSPFSGFVDMRRRHPSLDPKAFAAKWTLVNGASALWAKKAPDRVALITLRDLLEKRDATLRDLCGWLGVDFDPGLLVPSWRGALVPERDMGPFGGVPYLSAMRETALASELDPPTVRTLSDYTKAVAHLIGLDDDAAPFSS